MNRRILIEAVAASVALPLFNRVAVAQTSPKTKNVVFVHGLFADGSCWSKVIARLQPIGVNCTSVQNPLTSLRDASEAAQRAIAAQPGPTVLVGHSFSGTIVSEVGADLKVTALVYVAARAPDAGEDYTVLANTYPTPPATAGIIFHDDWGQLSEEAFLRDFAGDLPPEEARAYYAVQQPFKKSLTTEKTSNAAWRQADLLCRVHPRPHNQSRPGALHGQTNGCEDDRDRGEPPSDDLTSRCDHELDRGGTRRLRQVARPVTRRVRLRTRSASPLRRSSPIPTK
jgi:pimeloyl-ACP methyl ester carboxylesterase